MTPFDLLISIARVTVVSLLACALGRVMLRRRPESTVALALTALLSCCGLLAITGADWPTIWESSINESTVETTTSAVSITTVSTPLNPSEPGFTPRSLRKLLTQLDTINATSNGPAIRWYVVCIVGVSGLSLARLLLGMFATARIHRTSCVTDHLRLQQLMRELTGTDSSIPELVFRVSARVHAPCVAAFGRQTVYLPEDWIEYTDDELSSSVAHEVGHLLRNDARWRLLAQLATAAQFFHPLSHRLLHQLVLGQELSADNWAANVLGRSRFLSGISQLALRLDSNAALRHPVGIGMSHSSSHLIRRITMVRNETRSSHHTRGTAFPRAVALLVVLAAVLSASWSISAEDKVRLASRSKTTESPDIAQRQTEPWEILPGYGGYWTVNVNAVLQHPVIGPQLRQLDSTILTMGWAGGVRPDAINKRSDLGLSIDNIASIAGSATVETKGLKQVDSRENFSTSYKTSAFVIHMAKQVDWTAVGKALDEDRLNATIEGLVGPEFPEESAKKLIEAGIVSAFFEQQSNPLQFVLSNEEKATSSKTAAQIPQLWRDHSGELATLIFRFPKMSGHTETRYQKLGATIHQTAEYSIVSIDRGSEPDNLRIRFAVSPQAATKPSELADTVTEFLEATVEQFRDDVQADDGSAELEKQLLLYVERCRPEIVNSADADGISAVVVTVELPASLFLQTVIN